MDRGGKKIGRSRLSVLNDSSLSILGCRVDALDSAAAVDRISAWIHERRPAHVVTFGAEMAALAVRDDRYRQTINDADLVVPDTVGVIWASRMVGHPLPERVAGIELVEAVLAANASRGVRVFVLGAGPGAAETAAQSLATRFPGVVIAGMHHGFFDADHDEDVARLVRSANANLVIVALGFPNQEYWIRKNLTSIGGAVCIGVGGAVDVWAGRAARAPAGWRRLGLEWLYRLLREPNRFRRQLALPRFAMLVLAQALRGRTANRT
jgi:N-acetylglucosaminyldiphosphoundecaprenol N-acetyl-beta-D-mannosaminyltransferase